MRKAAVLLNGERVGLLTELARDHYRFRYDDVWFANEDKPSVSLSLPKSSQQYESDHLFPFFFNLLSEGVNRRLQSRYLRIDERDHFGLLLATAGTDTIGAVTIKEIRD